MAIRGKVASVRDVGRLERPKPRPDADLTQLTRRLDKMTSVADNEQHWCCNCGQRIITLHIAREQRGNRAEVCSAACAAYLDSPEYQRFLAAMRHGK